MVRQTAIHRGQFTLHLANSGGQRVNEFTPEQRCGLVGRLTSLSFVSAQLVRFHFLDKRVHPWPNFAERLAFDSNLRHDAEPLEIVCERLSHQTLDLDTIGFCSLRSLRGCLS